jgi:hypothetical protein
MLKYLNIWFGIIFQLHVWLHVMTGLAFHRLLWATFSKMNLGVIMTGLAFHGWLYCSGQDIGLASMGRDYCYDAWSKLMASSADHARRARSRGALIWGHVSLLKFYMATSTILVILSSHESRNQDAPYPHLLLWSESFALNSDILTGEDAILCELQIVSCWTHGGFIATVIWDAMTMTMTMKFIH